MQLLHAKIAVIVMVNFDGTKVRRNYNNYNGYFFGWLHRIAFRHITCDERRIAIG